METDSVRSWSESPGGGRSESVCPATAVNAETGYSRTTTTTTEEDYYDPRWHNEPDEPRNCIRPTDRPTMDRPSSRGYAAIIAGRVIRLRPHPQRLVGRAERPRNSHTENMTDGTVFCYKRSNCLHSVVNRPTSDCMPTARCFARDSHRPTTLRRVVFVVNFLST